MGSGLPPGRALYSAHDRVVSADPADATPHVLDGKVETILPMGNRVYIGGSFTQVRNADESRVIARRGLFALDPATNKVDEAFVADFDVNPDRAQERGVKALAPAPGNNELFVGGEFGTLNGAAARKLVKLNAVTGAARRRVRRVGQRSGEGPGGQRPAALRGRRLRHRRSGSPAAGWPPSTSAPAPSTPTSRSPSPLPARAPNARVETIGVTPDGATLVAGGNFTRGRRAVPRGRSPSSTSAPGRARLIDWQTDRFNDRDPQGELRCAPAFDSHPRDVDVSPDGA